MGASVLFLQLFVAVSLSTKPPICLPAAVLFLKGEETGRRTERGR